MARRRNRRATSFVAARTEITVGIVDRYNLDDLKTYLDIVALVASQQGPDKDEDDEPLVVLSIGRPLYSILPHVVVRNALHAFAVIFSFDSSGRQVTAAMLGESKQTLEGGGGGGGVITVYIAKNGGAGVNNDKRLGKAMSACFRERSNGIPEAVIFQTCKHSIMDGTIACRRYIISTLESFDDWPTEYTSWEEIKKQISGLLEEVWKMYLGNGQPTPEALQKLLKNVWNWVKENETKLATFRRLLMKGSLPKVLNTKHVNICLGHLEDMSRYHRAFEDLLLFRETLDPKVVLKFLFLKSPPEAAPYNQDENLDSPKRECKSSRCKPQVSKPSIHCEMQLLNHFHTQLTAEARSEIWRYIGCSKLPCFCCFYMLRGESGFKTEQSHYRVYSSWSLPKKLLDFVGCRDDSPGDMPGQTIVDGLVLLQRKLEVIVERAQEEGLWRACEWRDMSKSSVNRQYPVE